MRYHIKVVSRNDTNHIIFDSSFNPFFIGYPILSLAEQALKDYIITNNIDIRIYQGRIIPVKEVIEEFQTKSNCHYSNDGFY